MAAATASAAGSAVGSGSSTPTGGTGAVMGTVSGISGTSGGSSSSSASDVKNVLEKHRKTMLRLDTNTNLKIKKDGCAPSPMSARGKGPAIPLPLQTNSESIDASAVISGQLMGGSAASFSAMLPLPGIHGGKAQPSPSGLGLLAVTFASSSSPSGSDDDHSRLDILAGVPALVNVPPELLHTIARHCKALRFEAGSIILQARGDRSHLYFMTSGHCKAIRSVPFRRLLKSPPGSHVSLKPLEPGVTVLNPSLEESTFLTLHAGDISAGDYFPRLSLTRSEYHEFKAQLVPSSKLVLLLEALLAHGPRQFEDAFMSSENNLVFAKPADSLKIVDMTIPQEAEDAMIALDMEVTASSRVDCLQIGRVDLIKILTEEALVNFVNPRYESVAGIALYELQEAYLERLSGDADGPPAPLKSLVEED
ncbi:hypothetical protein BC831DRAFT_512939 [Entophlyctis helioformis]|nr:hypothetical protein BC831DRAFT_512939 [Entophlyctis helioformis]